MLKYIFTFPIRLYQRTFSKILPATCKFEPCCSQYALDCIEKYGIIKGFFRAFYRILRCNPFSRGGCDPA